MWLELGKTMGGKPWVQKQGLILPGYTYPCSVVPSAWSGGRKTGQASDNGPAGTDSNSQFLVISSPCRARESQAGSSTRGGLETRDSLGTKGQFPAPV